MRQLHILIIEDRPEDTKLVLRALQRAGYEPSVDVVATKAAYLDHLHDDLDLILADYDLPQFTGMEALQLMQQHNLDIPFILVTDAIGEERAVECLKQGAADYLLKDRLTRLGPAVEHALAEKRLRDENRHALAALHDSKERLEMALDGLKGGLWDWNVVANKIYVNPEWLNALGFRPGQDHHDIDIWRSMLHPDEEDTVIKALNAFVHQEATQYEQIHRIQHRDGHWLWVLDRGQFVAWDDDGNPTRVIGTHIDITEHIEIENTLAHLNSVLLAIRNVNQLITKAKSPDELLQAACDILTETRGYDLAWITLLGDDCLPTLYAISGDQKHFLALANQLKNRSLPICAQKALGHDDIVVTYEAIEGCSACSTDNTLKTNSAMTVQLRYDDHTYGVLTVSLSRDYVENERERNLFEEVAQDLAYALYNLESEAARRRAEDALHAAYQTLEAIVENTHILIAILTPEFEFMRVNQAFARAYGNTPDFFTGKNYFALYPEQQDQAIFRHVVETGNPFIAFAKLFSDHPAPDEQSYWDWAVVPIKNAAGKTQSLIYTLLDVTERVQAEAEVRAQRDRAQTYFDAAGVMLVVLDTDGAVKLINRRGCEILQYGDESAIVGRNWADNFLPANQRQPFIDSFRRMLAGEETPEYTESEVLAQDGKLRLIGWHNTILRDANGSITGMINSGEDITARRNAEHARLEQHAFTDALSEIAAVLNETLDFDTVIQRILDTVGRVMPHDSANIMRIEGDCVRVIGHRGYAERGLDDWIETIDWPLDSVPNLKAQVEHASTDIISDVSLYDHWRPEDEVVWVRSFASAPIIVDQAVVGFLNLDKGEPNFYTEEHAEHLQAFANQASVAIKNAQLYDMVQRHAAELEQRVAERTSELRESEARYRAIVEDQTELIIRYLDDGTVTFANRAYCRYFSITLEEAKQNLLDMDDITQTVSPSNPVTVSESRVTREDGDVRWLQWTNRMIMDSTGAFIEYQSVGRDITERRHAEEVLRTTLAREVELGELKTRFVSMVSHEFRNPLAVILMNNDMLHRYHDRLSDEQRAKYTQTIRTHVQSMTDLLEDLLLLSQSEAGKLEIKPEPIDLRAFCQRIIDDVRTTHGEGVTFSFDLSGDADAVTDAKLFRLIATNLISNAAKYSEPGGTIAIDLNTDSEHLLLRVSDDGIGIPQRDQERLFETFHRASNVGKRPGTGLGLTLVKQCVEQLGGTLTLISEEHVGTTVTITLPHLDDEARSD